MYNQSLYMNKSAFKRFNLFQFTTKNKHVNGLIKLNDNKMVVLFLVNIQKKTYDFNF